MYNTTNKHPNPRRRLASRATIDLRFSFSSPHHTQVAATVGQGGDTLVEMVTALSLQGGSKGGRFFATEPGKPDSSFSEQAVSVEAQDQAKGKRLWELSAGCVGLGSKTPI